MNKSSMENLKSSTKEDLLKAQLEAVNAQNFRLKQENNLLRQKLQTFTAEEHSSSAVYIEAKLNAFKFEEERDRMYEKLEKIKRKYNRLHEAYLQKVKRCKALEDVFSRQKTLNGLVIKSAIELQGTVKPSINGEKQTTESLEAQLAKLQTDLNEAYDIIDELEFELESVDFLEVEIQRLRNDLEKYEKEKLALRRDVSNSHQLEFEQTNKANETSNESYDELPEYRQNDVVVSSGYDFDSNASSLVDSIVGDDLDPALMERSALTESLIQMAESESNRLRRELLRSRLQKTCRPNVPLRNSDA